MTKFQKTLNWILAIAGILTVRAFNICGFVASCVPGQIAYDFGELTSAIWHWFLALAILLGAAQMWTWYKTGKLS